MRLGGPQTRFGHHGQAKGFCGGNTHWPAVCGQTSLMQEYNLQPTREFKLWGLTLKSHADQRTNFEN
jgi:hypothetical protein